MSHTNHGEQFVIRCNLNQIGSFYVYDFIKNTIVYGGTKYNCEAWINSRTVGISIKKHDKETVNLGNGYAK